MNAFLRVMAASIGTAALLQPINAQPPVPTHQPRVFIASDKAFRFAYSADFHLCKGGEKENCIPSYIPVCEEDALVCVVNRFEEFKETNFGEASFQVREILRDQSGTANGCVTPYPMAGWPEFQVSAAHPVETVGDVKFLHGVSGEINTGHWSDVDLYRVLHNHRCFELSITRTGVNPSVTDPPMETLTPAQQRKLDQSTSEILHSFRFLK
jgi:hypothetical protein